jgi:hypothetical protein
MSFGALDAQTRERCRRSCFASGALETVFVTHDVREAVYLADRAAVMTARPGKIKALITRHDRSQRAVALMAPEFARSERDLGAGPRGRSLPSGSRASGSREAVVTIMRLAACARYAPLLLVAAGWELAVLSGAISPNFLPRFSEVMATLWELLRSFELPREIGISLLRQSIGFALAVVIGVTVGVTMARLRLVDRALRPLVTLGYPVPVVALFPVLVLMVGLDHRLQIIVILLGPYCRRS